MSSTGSFDRAAATYDAHADLQHASGGELAKELVEALPPARPGSVILDVGCGSGLAGSAAREAGWRGGVVGFDLAAEMCRAAAARGHLVARADARALPFRDGAFAGAICSWSLQWVPERQVAIRELRRVLLPNAPLVLAVPTRGTLRTWREALVECGMPVDVEPAFHAPEEWRRDLAAGGFAALRSSTHERIVHHSTARGLLWQLRRTGASGPPTLGAAGSRRAVLRAVRMLDSHGSVAAEYHVTHILATREQADALDRNPS